MFDLGIAILTYNKPNTLENTLNSYSKYGFLEICSEKIILLQGNNDKEREIALKYGFSIYSTDENIGIGKGNNLLVSKLTSKYFIILQNDFCLIDDFKNEITNGIDLLEKNVIDCYRLRHLQNPGIPCYGAYRIPGETIGETHSSEVLYYDFIKEPELRFPHMFEKYKINENNIYIISSKYCNYTENPCMYNRQWYIDTFYSLNDVNGTDAEVNVQGFWEKNNFKIGMGNGLFTHNDQRC
jgi:hypothetical protein